MEGVQAEWVLEEGHLAGWEEAPSICVGGGWCLVSD